MIVDSNDSETFDQAHLLIKATTARYRKELI